MYRIINILSIDISLGAVVVAWFFCLVFGVSPEWTSLLVLGLCVWMVYTADHLLDAKKIASKASTVRHQFHQHNFKLLLTLTIAMGIGTAILVFTTLTSTIISLGLVLAGLSLVYLLVQRFLVFMKECIGAILYTVGILIPVVGVSDFTMTSDKLFLVFQFLLVVLMNLILFSSFDRKKDELDHQFSIATSVSTPAIKRIIWVIFFLSIGVGGINIFILAAYPAASIIILVMSLLLAAIQQKQNYFAYEDRFRYVGDGIFFLPLLYLLLK